jgi:hypothetical protein
VVEQPQKTIYIGGQNGLDADGKVVGPTVGEQASHGGLASRPRRHHGYIYAAQQVRELPGVGDRLVSEAVVQPRGSAVLSRENAGRSRAFSPKLSERRSAAWLSKLDTVAWL